jgi:hypothetical protein
MDAGDLLTALLDLAQELGIAVRTVETGSGRAASLVRLKGREVLFVDCSADLDDRIEAVAAALWERPELADRFLLPEVRAAIERAGPGA